jgi:hypothetical protein
MTAAADQSNFPTMIIPRGTDIRVNNHGQLSIKTPGNLVIQNSGVYSELESTNGSIRIEENVVVEAVSIKAAQACFIQGTVTAWKVHAKRITLEDRAKAFIMLQESEVLELAKSSRLVGNFANEKELFLMMGKFTGQLKELPGSVDMTSQTALAESRPISQQIPAAQEPDYLRAAQTILEREVMRADLAAGEVEALREVLFALRERNVARVGVIFRDALGEVKAKSDGVRQASDYLERYFSR